MEEKIKVLGVEMNCLTAKETMVLAMQFMENDPVDTIEMMTMDSLMNNQDDENYKPAKIITISNLDQDKI